MVCKFATGSDTVKERACWCWLYHLLGLCTRHRLGSAVYALYSGCPKCKEKYPHHNGTPLIEVCRLAVECLMLGNPVPGRGKSRLKVPLQLRGYCTCKIGESLIVRSCSSVHDLRISHSWSVSSAPGNRGCPVCISTSMQPAQNIWISAEPSSFQQWHLFHRFVTVQAESGQR